jgi:uncharacterized lipoprotein YddW (UPF0748 family)
MPSGNFFSCAGVDVILQSRNNVIFKLISDFSNNSRFLPFSTLQVKMMNRYMLFLLCFMMLSGVVPASGGERGTWVIRFDIDSPAKVKRICSRENQHQFDRYLVQVRGRADSWYESSFVPKAEDVSDFDPLAAILEQCTDVEVHVWLNVYYLWTGDAVPHDLRHPYYRDAWILKDRTGRSLKDYSELEQRQHWLEGVYADPASPGYRAYFVKVVRELIEKYRVAGVHLDFTRYPGSYFGDDETPVLSRITRQGLAVWINRSGDKKTRALLGNRLVWDQKRADNVTALVRDVKKMLTEVDPEISLSASVFPDIVEAFLDKGQKWVDWLQEDLLDDLYIMAYFGEPARVQSQIRQCRKICDRYNVRMWAGLGAYIKSPAEIQQEIARANRIGVSDICLFSLGHLLKQKKRVDRYQLSADVPVLVNQPDAGLSPLADYVLTADFRHIVPVDVPVNIPEKTIKLRGIFRYVDSHDDYAKVQDQYEIMQDVQQKLQSGKSFTKISRKYSQAGTKRYGGVLPDLHYIDAETAAMQRLFLLRPGEYSEIIPVYNGFWLFQILEQDVQ